MIDSIRYVLVAVDPSQQGERLDVFLARRFRRSRTMVRHRLEGQVLSQDGSPLKWSHRLQPEETIWIGARQLGEPLVQVAFCLLYWDAFILVVDKGAGAPVHPARSWRARTVLTQLRRVTCDPGLKPVHRLDRETSGVLVFGRSAETVSGLMGQFRRGQVVKRYLAVVRGEPEFDRLRVEAPLALDKNFPVGCRMRVDPKQGRMAVTDLEVLRRCNDRSLLSVVPRTGRQHQIRVHLAHVGHPVLGDKLYQEQGRPYLAMLADTLDEGMLQRIGHIRQALHAEQLGFTHPVSQTEMLIRAPLPDDLQRLLG